VYSVLPLIRRISLTSIAASLIARWPSPPACFAVLPSEGRGYPSRNAASNGDAPYLYSVCGSHSPIAGNT